MVRELQSKMRYILSFLIGTFIFIFIFILSYSLSYFEFQRISNIQEDIAYKIFEDKLDSSLFEENICIENHFTKITEDLRIQGRIIDDLEKKLGKENKDVLFRKKFYSLIELEHFEFVQEFNKQCDFDMNIVLFFYSNKKENLDKSEDMGRLLDILHGRNEKVIIYSFDSNLDSDLIRKLKMKFDIDNPITVLINNICKFEDLTALKELENCLN